MLRRSHSRRNIDLDSLLVVETEDLGFVAPPAAGDGGSSFSARVAGFLHPTKEEEGVGNPMVKGEVWPIGG